MKKIYLIILIIGLITIPTVCGALNSNLKAPDEFDKASNWDKVSFDIYTLKTDNNTQLWISEYTDEDYDLFFKTDKNNDYYVSDLSNNMIMGKDNYFHQGYVFEIIEVDGHKYIVNSFITNNPSNDKIKDSSKYLEEFNKLNNVQPLKN